MTDSDQLRSPRATALPETLSLAVLVGLQRLPRAHAEFVHGAQLRAADRMLGLCTVLAGVSIFLIDFRLVGQVPGWLLMLWTALAVAAYVPSLLLARVNRATGYAEVGRSVLVRHGILTFLQAMVWVAAMAVFADRALPNEIVMIWTIACCLMAATTLAQQSTPLGSVGFTVTVGGGAIWMMMRQHDPLLVAVVTTYALLLLTASLRQANLFGIQLTTNKMLAEKREVVSLLLKEHDIEAADALWQTDAARRLTDVSDAFARMLGAASDEIEGRSILEVLAGPAWESGRFDPAMHILADKLKNRQPFSDLVMPVLVGDQQRWWEISASPRIDDKGVFQGFRGVGSDITVEKESAERISQMARYDLLTGLPNRLHLTEELGAVLEGSTRWKTRCGFLMIDLDRFKAINDTLGHLVGDQLLAQVGERLRAVCSPNELCGRLGGDEFAVIIREVMDQAYVDRIANAVIYSLSQPYEIDVHHLLIGASVGSAIAPQDALSAESLIRCADLALYRSKDGGRGSHQRFLPSMKAEADERRQLEVSLREALANEELHLVYQPLVDLQAADVVAFEALARWTHPQLGAIPPARFIPIAEEARLISAIGNWVLRTACQEAMTWPAHVHVSVNVSVEQLYEAEFLETVVSALAHSGLGAERLHIEVTEGVVLREDLSIITMLEKLRQLGVGLVLDDFGTGYSALNHLSRNRFNAIKIDRKFVAAAGKGERESIAVIRAVVAMAEGLDMVTTAEGVESEADFELVRTLGCRRVQGYYFGRPMQAKDARALFGDAAGNSQVA